MSQGKVLHSDVELHHTFSYDLRTYINILIGFFFFYSFATVVSK